MRTYTVNELMKLDPCGEYPKKRIAKLWGDRKRLGLNEILDLKIPGTNRIWAAIHCLNAKEQSIFANKIADRAVKKLALTCGITELEAWAAKWLAGEDRTEAAAGAARAAAWDAWDAETEWQLRLLHKMANKETRS